MKKRCTRTGTVALGGHCLVCGVDVSPGEGIALSVPGAAYQAGVVPLHESKRSDMVIMCSSYSWSDACRSLFDKAVYAERLYWASREAKHLKAPVCKNA